MKRMVISRRLNMVQGRHADSWARVIGGRLFLFIHGHSPTAGGTTRERMTTRSVIVYELEWDEFPKLADNAAFMWPHDRYATSTLRHVWRAS